MALIGNFLLVGECIVRNVLTDFVVYVKDNCVQCRLTMDWLEKRGFPVVTADAVEHVDVLAEKGFKAAPVVIAPDGKAWSGFRPDLLAEFELGSVS